MTELLQALGELVIQARNGALYRERYSLFTAAVEEVLHFPANQLAGMEGGDSDQDTDCQISGEQQHFMEHVTASLYGPDEICTSAGSIPPGTPADPGRAEGPAGPGWRLGYR